MGRMPRIQVEKAIYYILSGGDNNQPIFRLDEDSATYLEILSQYKRQHPFKLFAYCLVPGTISLLIEPSAAISVSDIMHDLNSKYTKYFNRKYGKTGHLFQERYRMILIEKESKLLEMTAYINLKPKLQIPPYDINTYPYSSYSAYIKEDTLPKGPDIGEEIKEVRSYLKGDTYQEIVAKIALNKLSEVDDELAAKTIIGSEKFVNDVKSRMSSLRAPKGRSNLKEIASAASRPRNDEEPSALEPDLEHGFELEPQPEPEPEQLLEPDPQPAPELKPVLVPDTKLSIESMEQPVPVPALKDESVPDTKPFTKPKSNILISIVIVILSVIVIACSILFTYTKTIEMKKYLDAELSRKDSQLKNKLDKERNSLYKTLTDRYGAEKANYLEKAQRLEFEKETYKTTAERLETEKNSYQEMAKRLSDEKTSAQAAAERLEQEKKKIEEQLILIQKQPSSL